MLTLAEAELAPRAHEDEKWPHPAGEIVAVLPGRNECELQVPQLGADGEPDQHSHEHDSTEVRTTHSRVPRGHNPVIIASVVPVLAGSQRIKTASAGGAAKPTAV